MIPFENRTDIVRDPFSKAIISTNKAAYVEAKKRKEQEVRYIKMEKEVVQIKKDMNEIKQMLEELLNRGIK